MRHLCCSRLIIDILQNSLESVTLVPNKARLKPSFPSFTKILFFFILFFTHLIADENYAFIYSKNIDNKFINFYDKVVVEADAIDNIYAIRYPKKMVAYVSVGEIEPWRKTPNKYKKSWVISKNKTWNSLIADLRKEEYQNFIFERINSLYKKGYRNFFLDTMDAYHVTEKDKELFKTQQKALVSFIHKLHKKYPDSKLIVNRGFEILDKIYKDIDGVVAESLLSRYNHDKKEYVAVPKADRTWLLNRLKKAKKYGLDAISIEYTDKGTKERLKVAKDVKKLGIIPYVTDGLLQNQGECDKERIRRDILILFNSSMFKDNNAVYSDVHLLASMPLEYWGYVPILHDISTKDLPQRVEDRYHAVIVWSEGETKNNEKLYEWAKSLRDKNIKILFLNSWVFNPSTERLKEFGVSYSENNNSFVDKIEAKYTPPYKPYEMSASIDYEDELIFSKNSKKVLTTIYKDGQKSMPIAVTPWGGYALHSSFLHSIKTENFWTINPFIFFKDALRLDNIPVPDPTTEAGRRILFIHVDGDGFMEIVRTDPTKLASEYLLEHIYKKYHVPQTISLVQGEVDSIGLYPKLSPRMKKIAREIYKLPWIEPASHTLSHPFFWGQADENLREKERKKSKSDLKLEDTEKNKKISKQAEGHYHLPIPNYDKFNLKRETKESVNFILSLSPKSKQKKRILFWSGDCLPTRVVLAYCERDGILGMNGGDTTIKKSDPWLSHLAPFGVQREEYWQIYTAQQNENVYTHDWLGPFWGYRDAIETFKLTEEPYRIKPINVYYHFYSGSKLASFNALDTVYKWALKQETSKLYASQYIRKGRGFYSTSIGKIDGGFEIINSGFLRTVRFDKKIYIDMKNSSGVAGYRYHKNSTYVTLDSHKKQRIILSPYRLDAPYLIDSNGWVVDVNHHNGIYNFKLQANVPLEANFYMPSICRVVPPKDIHPKISKDRLSILLKKRKGVDIAFECQ